MDISTLITALEAFRKGYPNARATMGDLSTKHRVGITDVRMELAEKISDDYFLKDDDGEEIIITLINK